MGIFGKRREREAAWEAAATSIGLRHDSKDPFDLRRLLSGLLPVGPVTFASDVVHGRYRGRDVRLFEWFARTKPNEAAALIGVHTGVRTHELAGAMVDLGVDVRPVVLLRHGPRYRGEQANVFVHPTGHPGLDARFTCETRSPQLAAALADEAFASAVLTAPADFSVELLDHWLVLVYERRPADQLGALAAFATGLAEVVPAATHVARG